MSPELVEEGTDSYEVVEEREPIYCETGKLLSRPLTNIDRVPTDESSTGPSQ